MRILGGVRIGRPRRIVVIDDEEIVRDSCTAILADGDYEVLTAEDGETGLQLVAEKGADLVFVDLKMPGKSGFEVIEGISAIDPTIVTIVITGFATVSSAVDAMKRGAYDFLPKPFTPDEFRLISRRGLERRALVLEAAELRREREALRENFAAIVSHELKSPLSAIQQNLFVLSGELENTLTDDQKRRLDRMKSRINDMLGLIRTWMRWSSADVSVIKESFAPVLVKGPIAKAIESVEPLAQRKSVYLSSEIEDPALAVVGDEGTLTEAFLNVISNAVKYSFDEGKVVVRVHQAQGKVVVSVCDNGAGIPAEDLPHVFDDFYRARGTETAGGAGLGLALTRRIVEAHDGTITADSEVGKGSTFVITLPAAPSGDDAGRPGDEPAGLGKGEA